MIWMIAETGMWLVAAMLAGAVVYVVLRVTVLIIRGRVSEISQSRQALEEYEQLFDKVVDDASTPASVRELLDHFDRGVMDRGSAHFVATSIFRNRDQWLKKREEPRFMLEMREVGKFRPDLPEAFSKLIAAGFAATMLRWAFPARALTLLLIDIDRDPVTPARVVACAADRQHPPTNALPAAA
jgi:hypothetical protein